MKYVTCHYNNKNYNKKIMFMTSRSLQFKVSGQCYFFGQKTCSCLNIAFNMNFMLNLVNTLYELRFTTRYLLKANGRFIHMSN